MLLYCSICDMGSADVVDISVIQSALSALRQMFYRDIEEVMLLMCSGLRLHRSLWFSFVVFARSSGLHVDRHANPERSRNTSRVFVCKSEAPKA